VRLQVLVANRAIDLVDDNIDTAIRARVQAGERGRYDANQTSLEAS
jgi:hypothetical protein